jgi:hypothetical protein
MLSRCSVRLTDGLLCGFTGTLGAYLRPDDPAAIEDFSRFRTHVSITATLARLGNATRI